MCFATLLRAKHVQLLKKEWTYHGVQVLQLIEKHEFDSDEGVVVGAHITHIALELRREAMELGELSPLWDEATRRGGILTMPHKLMEPRWEGTNQHKNLFNSEECSLLM